MTTSVGDDYPKQQARMRELIKRYEACGPGGWWGAATLEADLAESERAAISGDLPWMLRMYAIMKAAE